MADAKLNTGPSIFRDVVCAADCAKVIDLLDRCARGLVPLLCRRLTSRCEFAYRELCTVNDSSVRLIANMRLLCLTLAKRAAGSVDRFYPEFTLLAMNFPGDTHALHADNARFDPELNAWIPNHTPSRTFSALLYLNTYGSDFTGGRLCFPQHGLTISPERGLFVTFPSDEFHLHEVEPVRSGIRVSMACWYTDRVDRSEEDRSQHPIPKFPLDAS